MWVARRYGNETSIIVTENGCVDPIVDRPMLNDRSMLNDRPMNDSFRINYHREYLAALKKAKDVHGVNVDGYFIWSLLDNVEWGDGYSDKFGLYSVAHPSLERIAKASATWFAKEIFNWYL